MARAYLGHLATNINKESRIAEHQDKLKRHKARRDFFLLAQDILDLYNRHHKMKETLYI